jgi:hypothetical protein
MCKTPKIPAPKAAPEAAAPPPTANPVAERVEKAAVADEVKKRGKSMLRIQSMGGGAAAPRSTGISY